MSNLVLYSDVWTKMSTNRKAYRDSSSAYEKAPLELQCNLCRKLLRDAVASPCCKSNFCDECIRKELLESQPQFKCPICQCELVPDQLIVNQELRSNVDSYLREKVGHGKRAAEERTEYFHLIQKHKKAKENKLIVSIN